MPGSTGAAESPEIAKTSRARIVKEKEAQANEAVNQYLTAKTISDESLLDRCRLELHLATLEYYYAIRPMGQEFDSWDQTALWWEQTDSEDVAKERASDNEEIESEIVDYVDENGKETKKTLWSYPVRGLDVVPELASNTEVIEEQKGGTFSPAETVQREVTVHMEPERAIELISILDEIKNELGLNPSTEYPIDHTDLSVMAEEE